MTVTVIGAGLAGCGQPGSRARRGIDVTLYEMKPKKDPAHTSDSFAELLLLQFCGARAKVLRRGR